MLHLMAILVIISLEIKSKRMDDDFNITNDIKIKYTSFNEKCAKDYSEIIQRNDGYINVKEIQNALEKTPYFSTQLVLWDLYRIDQDEFDAAFSSMRNEV